MARFRRFSHPRAALPAAIVTGALVTSLLVGAGTSQAATQGPCDLYAAGGTPCVAAHSTTRALYGSYNGALYQSSAHRTAPPGTSAR